MRTLNLFFLLLCVAGTYLNSYTQNIDNAPVSWTIEDPFGRTFFIENKGQFNNEQIDNIKYSANEKETEIYFTPTSVTYCYKQFPVVAKRERELMRKASRDNNKELVEELKRKYFDPVISMFTIEWLGANTNTRIISDEKLNGYYTYPVYDAKEGEEKTIIANAYKKLTYKNIYPGIDLEYFFTDKKGGIKYSFIVHPGASPDKIKMKYTGGKINLNNNGSLNIETAWGKAIEYSPVTFLEKKEQHFIKSSFAVNNDLVSFNIGHYDTKQTLIIDPWVQFPTLPSNDKAYDIIRDNNGNVFIYGGDGDVCQKYNSAGTWQWTYTHSNLLGGYALGDINVDQNGNLYFLCWADTKIDKVSPAGLFLTQYNLSLAPGPFTEPYRLATNCSKTKMLVGGGDSGNSPIRLAELNLAGNNMTSTSTMLTVSTSELRSFCIDGYTGNIYSLHVTNGGFPGSTATNYLTHTSSAFANLFTVSDNYTLWEKGSPGDYVNPFHPGGFNGIIAGKDAVYSYDGQVINKYNKTTGVITASVAVNGAAYYLNSGITLDSCGNVYVGAGKQIVQYDNNLSLLTTVATPDTVYDLTLGDQGEILACGNGFVGAYSGFSTLTLSIASTTTPCGQSLATATVTPAGLTYNWNTGDTTQVVTGLSSGVYTVSVTGYGSCHSCLRTASVTINSPSTLSVTITPVNAACGGTGSAQANVSGGSGTYTYSWSTTPIQTVPNATGLTVGNYTLLVTDNVGCTITSTVSIAQSGLLTSSITSTSTTICGGGVTTLTASPTGGSPAYTFLWSNGQTAQIASGLSAGTYSVLITDQNSCTTVSTITLTAAPIPQVVFSGNPLFGCEPLLVTFTDSSLIATPDNITSWLWSFGDGTTSSIQHPTHSYTAGTYTVGLTVTSNNGCTATLTIPNYITVSAAPTACFTMVPNGVITLLNSTINFYDCSANATSWNWNFGDPYDLSGNNQSTLQNPIHIYSDTGYYCVQLIVNNAMCADTTEKCFVITEDFSFYVPNTFTPNGDGKNEIFLPQGVGIETEGYELRIFDRWGDEIFFSNNITVGWNGKANGGQEIAQQDTYVWRIKLIDANNEKRSFVGHVNLIK